MGGYEGFGLEYPLRGACSIPDPETGTVIITGGNHHSDSSHPNRYRITSVYNEDGFIENLGNLKYQRYLHGCTSYVADKKRIFLVSGGDFTVSTEILEDGKWKILWNAKLPLPSSDALKGLRLATVANQVYSFGGYSSKGSLSGAISSIFKFNIEDEKWYNTSFDMSRPRYNFGTS